MANRGINYVKQDQPSFIKKFREKAGMKPEATLSDKMQTMPEDCVDDEKEDEKPVVVVLNEGDLTAEEADSHSNNEPSDGKIVFKKPTKRTKESALGGTTKKSRPDSNDKEKPDSNKKEKAKKSKSSKKDKQKMSSLLSFDEEDG